MYHKQISILFCVVQLLFYFSVYMVHFKQVYIDLCGVEFWHCAVIPHTGVLMGGFPLYLPLIGPHLSFSLFCIYLHHLSQATWFLFFWESYHINEYFKVVAENLLHWVLHFADVQPSLRDDVTDICPAYLQHCITSIRRTCTLCTRYHFFSAHFCLNKILKSGVKCLTTDAKLGDFLGWRHW